jgi:hypothetical protein
MLAHGRQISKYVSDLYSINGLNVHRILYIRVNAYFGVFALGSYLSRCTIVYEYFSYFDKCI